MGDEAPKHDIHVGIFNYQYEYLDDNNYNISAVIRENLDDWLIAQGVDPDRLETVSE